MERDGGGDGDVQRVDAGRHRDPHPRRRTGEHFARQAGPFRTDQERKLRVGADEKGGPLARIGAPFAVDAQGTVVPVALLVKENTVTLDFPHRSMDIAYPLFIDPEIEENWWGFADTSKLNYWSWQYSGVGPEDFIGWRSPIVTNWGNGLYVRSRSEFSYPGGSYGRWWFVPQGSTTYMRRVILGPMNYAPGTCTANEPHPFTGVWNDYSGWKFSPTPIRRVGLPGSTPANKISVSEPGPRSSASPRRGL